MSESRKSDVIKSGQSVAAHFVVNYDETSDGFDSDLYYLDKIDGILTELRLQGSDPNDYSYTELRTRLKNAYEEYKGTTCPSIPSFDVLEPEILRAIQFCKNH